MRKADDCYLYYCNRKDLNFIKWYDDHDQDMAYRYSGGKTDYTLKEIKELGEEKYIIMRPKYNT